MRVWALADLAIRRGERARVRETPAVRGAAGRVEHSRERGAQMPLALPYGMMLSGGKGGYDLGTRVTIDLCDYPADGSGYDQHSTSIGSVFCFCQLSAFRKENKYQI